MKTLNLILLLCVFGACQQSKLSKNDNTTSEKSAAIEKDTALLAYDSVLAQQYGADAYGMKSYVFVYLKEGPNRSQDSTEAAQIQKGHMEHIGKMVNENKLVLAGPFIEEEYAVKGIFVLDVPLEEAQELVAQDPAVKSGRLIMELQPWYGTAALVGLKELHPKIAKTSF